MEEYPSRVTVPIEPFQHHQSLKKKKVAESQPEDTKFSFKATKIPSKVADKNLWKEMQR